MKETEADELIILNAQGEEIARHWVVNGRNQRIIVAAHYENIRSHARPARRPTTIQLPPPEDWWGLPPAPEVEARPLGWYDQILEVGT